MASSSSSSSPSGEHHLQDDDAVLSSLLLDLGRGYDDEQELEDEPDISSTAVENAPALGFDARAYHQLASEYYAQPLLLTGGEPTVAQWPKVQVGEEGTRTLLSKALDSCRVCRVTVPALVVGEEGEEEADGKKPRLATLQEKDIEVEDLDGARGLDAVLGQADSDKKQTSHQCCNRKRGDLFYAYGALDVSPLHHHHPRDDTDDSLPPSDPAAAAAAAAFWAAFPPPACLRQGVDTSTEARDSAPTTNNPLIVAANLWIGRNLTSRLHVDALDNLFCVSQGSKIVHLYSPWLLAELDPHPAGLRLPVESRWGSRLYHSPAQWPGGLQAHAVAHVKAGECIFIPAGWFHEVFSVSSAFSLAISFWCESPTLEASRKVRLRPSLLHLAAGGRGGGKEGEGGEGGAYHDFLLEQLRQRKRAKGMSSSG